VGKYPHNCKSCMNLQCKFHWIAVTFSEKRNWRQYFITAPRTDGRIFKQWLRNVVHRLGSLPRIIQANGFAGIRREI
jgi:hypothetical protein